MKYLCLFFAVLMLLPAGAAVWRMYLGPNAADRIMAIQVLGTTVTAILVLLALTSERNSLLDVSLVLSLLAAVTAVAFVQRAWPDTETDLDAD
ncbi:MAG: monovalent cation/H+ antiporter complex subunit F [Gammaproteobacteria bacterium]|nr:monovalent cation/H+ antiporter complex subunit F [Gammaproteobacteria bacterium]MDH4316547.1 monovalent cation/H+ antiporter complex subunit F [Gammaproteobacteria bacterium]MDH5215982.1 monovalent cation/H+ antiporter complex subunit F [Gammaproteobacteria bacterium]